MADNTILCSLKDGVAELTLNRPERMNAYTPQMGAELIQAFRRLGADAPLAVSERETRGMARLGRLPAAAEGVLSFVQKRRPEWKLKPSDVPEVD
jgi:enoyl-CoA hydratase/carnithine racemase